MIEAYKDYWTDFADFRGRTGINGYWLAVFAHMLVSIILTTVLMFTIRSGFSRFVRLFLGIFQLLSIVPSLSIIVRRLRDAGYQWTNLFWAFLPIAGPIILIVKLCKPSVTAGRGFMNAGSKPEESYDLWLIASGILLLMSILAVVSPTVQAGALGQMQLVWWISRISLVVLSVMLCLGKRDSMLLVPSALVFLTEIRSLFIAFNIMNLLTVFGWAAVCILIGIVILEKQSLPKVLMYIPAGIFLLISIFWIIRLIRVPGMSYLIYHNILRTAAFFCFGKALSEDRSTETSSFANNRNSFTSTVPPVPVPNGSKGNAGNKSNAPGILLVRFSIDKLNNLGGSYGFQAGKLIAKVVPASLLEGMRISDGDSAATLSGREYVYVVGIASDDISILRERVEPLLQADKEIAENGEHPVTQVISSTNEPLVLDGVVNNGSIIGGGGWCANGFMDGWKETAEKLPELPELPDQALSKATVTGGGGTIRAESQYQPKPNANYGPILVSLLFSVFLIIAGASGQFVLRGTSSSTALVIAGLGFLAWDIYSFIQKRSEIQKSTEQYSARLSKMRKEENVVERDKRILPGPVNIHITCDQYLTALNLGPRLNGNPMNLNANTSEYIGSTSRVQNIVNFNDVDLTAVFEIAPYSGDIKMELFHDMNGIGIDLPDNVRVIPREELH